MLPILAAVAAPFMGVVSNVIDYFKHSKEMAETTRQKELEIEKTKVELAKQAESAEQLTALEGLKQPLGDKGFRKFLVIAISAPIIMLIPDIFGFPQFGSDIVKQYFNLIMTVIPEEYRIFLVTMIGSYFGIVKVRETFFGKK